MNPKSRAASARPHLMDGVIIREPLGHGLLAPVLLLQRDPDLARAAVHVDAAAVGVALVLQHPAPAAALHQVEAVVLPHQLLHGVHVKYHGQL